MNLHFLMSSSKFLPYLLANRIPPSCPSPSLRTHVYAAAARFAYVIVLPIATKRLCVERNDMAVIARAERLLYMVNLR